VRFPLGGMTKEEVRAHARRLGLPNCDKPESQEICFVPDGDYASFVTRHVPVREGEIVDESGRVLGQHDGVHRFTIGQRRGIGVAFTEPLYVLSVDAPARRVTVGAAAALDKRTISVADCNWLPPARTRAQVQIRYRHEARPAWCAPDGNRVQVEFDQPERAPAPGQAAVFYDGETVLGGGFIA
jgi:tRNA-specific 2-thiouridylase